MRPCFVSETRENWSQEYLVSVSWGGPSETYVLVLENHLYLLNVVLFSPGMIALPFNMVSNTPVECTIIPDDPQNLNVSAFATVFSVAILVSEILDLLSPKDFGMT